MVVSIKTVTILIVEDDKICGIGLKLSLERFENFDIVGMAVNGHEAVEQAVKYKPQVILMDIGLPLMNGIEACRQIKAKNPDVRILMLTSHTDEKIINDSFEAGCDSYFNKDVDIKILSQSIQDFADGKPNTRRP